MKNYSVMTRNERTDASQVQPNSLVFMHVNKWNGSHEIRIVSVEVMGDKTVLISEAGDQHTVYSLAPVWVREYETREGLSD